MIKVAKIDNRNTPRINAQFYINFGDVTAKSLNLNDNGLSFETDKRICTPRISGTLQLPYGSPEINLIIIWEKEISADRKYIYGAKYENIGADKLNVIRKSIILKKAKDIIRNVRKDKERGEVKNFSKYALQYFFDVFELMNSLKKKTIKETRAVEKLHNLTEDIMQRADDFDNKINNKFLSKRIKKEFRDLVSCWAYKSFIVKRSYDKPQGYPGDYKIMENIYDKEILSKGIGLCFDRYFQNNEYAVAVRSRKDWMREYLKEYISSSHLKEIKILNIAGGSNREIRELLLDKNLLDDINKEGKKIIFNLLDQDEDAILYSQREFKKFNDSTSFRYFTSSIMAFLRNNDDIARDLQKSNLIYSIGLADYLPDRVLGTLMEIWINKYLEKDGIMIIAHKDITRYKPLPPNWFCDWNFCPRDERSINELIRKYCGGNLKIEICRDKTGLILFFILKIQ